MQCSQTSSALPALVRGVLGLAALEPCLARALAARQSPRSQHTRFIPDNVLAPPGRTDRVLPPISFQGCSPGGRPELLQGATAPWLAVQLPAWGSIWHALFIDCFTRSTNLY